MTVQQVLQRFAAEGLEAIGLGCGTHTAQCLPKWEQTADGRELRLYRLTPKGRKQLEVEESKWRQTARAMARMLRPA